ncbi:MAG: uridine kinase [Acidobacteria bacterium]|jgi:uridine kinase|nr:uridine kinase [Acidobacteriota bacterium]
MATRPPVILGIAGGTGSGKTTLAFRIASALGDGNAAILDQDSYYLDHPGLTTDELARLNFDHPESLDWRLLRDHIRLLRECREIEKPVYDFRTHSRRQDSVRIQPRSVIILEGILILEDQELRELIDLKIFVDAEPDVRFIRRLVRDVRDRGRSMDSVIRQYLDTVRPMHLEFVQPTRSFADIVVSDGGRNQAALESILAFIRDKEPAR